MSSFIYLIVLYIHLFSNIEDNVIDIGIIRSIIWSHTSFIIIFRHIINDSIDIPRYGELLYY